MRYSKTFRGLLILCALFAGAGPALADSAGQSAAKTVILASDDRILGVERTIAPGDEVLSSGVAIEDAFVTDHDIPLDFDDIHYIVDRGSLVYKTVVVGESEMGIYDVGTTTYCEKNRITSIQQMAEKIGHDPGFVKQNFDESVHVCFVDSTNQGYFDKAVLYGSKDKSSYHKSYAIEKIKYSAGELVIPDSRVGVRLSADGKTFAMFYIRAGVDLLANDFLLFPPGKKGHGHELSDWTADDNKIYFYDVFFEAEKIPGSSNMKIKVLHGFNKIPFSATRFLSKSLRMSRYINLNIY